MKKQLEELNLRWCMEFNQISVYPSYVIKAHKVIDKFCNNIGLEETKVMINNLPERTNPFFEAAKNYLCKNL